jgi:hypothetical protein
MKSLNTPNFSWGFFNFGLRRSARLLPRCYSFPLASRGKRDIKTKRDLLLRRRLMLKIPQLKLGVLREFSHSLQAWRRWDPRGRHLLNTVVISIASSSGERSPAWTA